MKADNRQLIGLIIVLLGVVFLLDNFGVIQSFDIGSLISTYWPLFLVGLGFSALIDRNYKVGLLLLTLGLVFQLSELFSVSAWGILWPLIIVYIGVSMLVGKPVLPDRLGNGDKQAGSSFDNKDTINEFTLFSENKKTFNSQRFAGGTISNFFGSTEIDLRGASINESTANISITCMFGSVLVYVNSSTYRVESDGTAILGSWESKVGTSDNNPVKLHISGLCLFGEVEVRS
jgi:predicted membrane protein